MREKLVNQLNVGEVLADSVITGDNQIIVPKGTVLKEEYINLMGILGIQSVMIQDYCDTLIEHTKILTDKEEKYYYDKIKYILERYIYKEQETLNQVKPLAIKLVDLVSQNFQRDIIYDFKPYRADLYKHTLHVTLLCIIMGLDFDMKKEKLYDLALGALLHDLGIRFISTDYYNFDMNLKSPKEILELKKHTILGYTVLENETWISDIVKKMVLSHHEKKNGEGYPLKQRNQEIECKIIQICDSFDGMISGMEHRKRNVEQAFEEITSQAKLYDEKLILKLQKIVALYPTGTKVKTQKSGKNAVVIKQTKYANKPKIYIIEENKITTNNKIVTINENE